MRVFLNLWGALGPLIGVLVGVYIANRNQRKHWIADRKVQEYQELITAMTRAFSAMLNRTSPMTAYGPYEQREFAMAEEQVLITISDRIFIWEKMDELKILQRWQKLTQNINTSRDIQALSNAVGEIRGNLILEARKAMAPINKGKKADPKPITP
jgi:hypothetical protein